MSLFFRYISLLSRTAPADRLKVKLKAQAIFGA
jgi:hypothetical protein